jgi:hypothetical protein
MLRHQAQVSSSHLSLILTTSWMEFLLFLLFTNSLPVRGAHFGHFFLCIGGSPVCLSQEWCMVDPAMVSFKHSRGHRRTKVQTLKPGGDVQTFPTLPWFMTSGNGLLCYKNTQNRTLLHCCPFPPTLNSLTQWYLLAIIPSWPCLSHAHCPWHVCSALDKWLSDSWPPPFSPIHEESEGSELLCSVSLSSNLLSNRTWWNRYSRYALHKNSPIRISF